MCVGYRTVRIAYPLPGMDDLFDQLHGVEIFSRDDHITLYRTRYGQFEFRVTPFGLCYMPATFQKLMIDTF
eukprot:402558-Pelagomonas_calceolata.AAC.1